MELDTDKKILRAVCSADRSMTNDRDWTNQKDTAGNNHRLEGDPVSHSPLIN